MAGSQLLAVVGWTSVYKWYLPTLSEIIGLTDPPVSQAGSLMQQRLKAERQWCGAIAALNVLLQQTSIDPVENTSRTEASRPLTTPLSTPSSLVLSGPLPVLEQPQLVASVSAWTFTTEPLGAATWMPFQLLPAIGQSIATSATSMLPLLLDDPLAAEQFCLVLTPAFSLVLTLGEVVNATGENRSAFLFSFEPEVVWQAWRSLRSRLMLTSPQVLGELDALVDHFPPVAPDYRTVMQFNRLLLAHLPEPIEWETGALVRETREVIASDRAEHHLHVASADADQANGRAMRERATAGQERESLDKLAQGRTDADLELLQAIAHEVRTPLSTIRTLTRLLLKRQDLSPDVLKRLKLIDQECTEQIDRFSLFFRAVELETAEVKRPLCPLATVSLAQVFQQNIPRWQQQASQHNLTLEVVLPQKLPLVVSDSAMLDQVLTGLFDRLTHTVPSGSHIQMRVRLAGHQLKLQISAKPQAGDFPDQNQPMFVPPLKSIGQLLMFQPETGNLSLNLAVTKNLFQALGGKLTVRQRPQQGEILTVFLPLGNPES